MGAEIPQFIINEICESLRVDMVVITHQVHGTWEM